MKDDPKLLQLMLLDQDRQNLIYQPGDYWRGYQKRVIRAIEKHGVANFRKFAEIGKGYADTVTRDPLQLVEQNNGLKMQIMKWITQAPKVNKVFDLYSVLIRNYVVEMHNYRSQYYEGKFGNWLSNFSKDFTIPDSLHAGCEDVVEINGNRYAKIYIDFLLRIENFSQLHNFTKLNSIFEIGGGFGAWPHLMLNMYSNIKKVVYLDIPPMIYIATQYFKHHFPGKVIDYRETRDMKRIEFSDNDDVEIVCVCPWQIENMNIKTDLFWNTASFSEMTPEIVENYAKHIKRNSHDDTRICLLLNKTEKHEIHNIALPRDIFNAFGSDMSFEPLQPVIEHTSHSQYWFGQHKSKVHSSIQHTNQTKTLKAAV